MDRPRPSSSSSTHQLLSSQSPPESPNPSHRWRHRYDTRTNSIPPNPTIITTAAGMGGHGNNNQTAKSDVVKSKIVNANASSPTATGIATPSPTTLTAGTTPNKLSVSSLTPSGHIHQVTSPSLAPSQQQQQQQQQHVQFIQQPHSPPIPIQSPLSKQAQSQNPNVYVMPITSATSTSPINQHSSPTASIL
ncbi:hypothetical protein HDU76_011101, partial [Blyttiomyces sp. JEL0837]